MEALWLQILVPVLLFIIMMSMGLELVPRDFRRALEVPKPVLVGLTGQILILPCLGFAIVRALDLPPQLAMGVIIIAACPGGAPSNIFSYLAGANLALSITLTAMSSIITLVTIPLWINFASQHFLNAGDHIRLPLVRTFFQLVIVTLLPVGIGMLLRRHRPDQVERWRRSIKRAMAVLFVIATTLIVATQWESVARHFPVAARGAFCLIAAALGTSYATARIFRLDRNDAFTISVEVGLQNGALATMIVVNLLQQPELIVFPGTYALLAFLPIGLWTIAHRMRSTGS